MVYFVSTFKVPVLLWTLLIAVTCSNKTDEYAGDGSALSRFLKQFIQPYIQGNESITDNMITDNTYSSSISHRILADVKDLIRQKVIELKPMLQDDEYNENTPDDTEESDSNVKLEGNDETTIIEFLPKKRRKTKSKSSLRDKKELDSFQKKIAKYKQMRKHITKLLDKEQTARSTKKLVRRTLDEMLGQLIERQCTWKSIDTTALKDHLFGARGKARNSMKKLKKLSDEDWMSLRKKYETFLEFHAGQQSEFMNVFQDYFLSFFNDTSKLAKRYKIRCQLVETDDSLNDKTFYRDGKKGKESECDHFKVCSDELNNFLNTTYNHMNDTAVRTFSDYAAMYMRDVQEVEAVSGYDAVSSTLDIISNFAEKETNHIFADKLGHFSLDENKKSGANYQLIKNFTITTIDEIKIALKKIMDKELRATNNQLFKTIEGDLNVNLSKEMDSLSRSIIDKVCKFFVVCNGRVAGTRRSGRRGPIRDNSENLFVKVQVTFDDELKKSFARIGQKKAWPGDLTRRLVRYLSVDNLTTTTDSPTITSGNNENQ